MEELGKRIKSVRLELGWTQNELLARMRALYPHVRLTQQALEQLENGDSKRTVYTVELAHALGVNPIWLVNDAQPKRLIDLTATDESGYLIYVASEKMPPEEKAATARFLHTRTQPGPYNSTPEGRDQPPPKKTNSG